MQLLLIFRVLTQEMNNNTLTISRKKFGLLVVVGEWRLNETLHGATLAVFWNNEVVWIETPVSR